MTKGAVSIEVDTSRRAVVDSYCTTPCHISENPYKHILCGQVFEPQKAASLLKWLETHAKWRYEDHCFYQQYACRNLADCNDENGNPLLGEDDVELLMRHVEHGFGVSLRRKQYHMTVHKLIPGQGIGVHTDRPDEGSETHRFVAHLNGGFKDSFGGHLLMFLDREGTKIANIIRPLHNSGVAFGLSTSSFHAVNNVSGGIRYSIVFSFWDISAQHEGDGVPTSAGANRSREKPWPLAEKYRRIVQFLDAHGADTILHGQGTLLDHLVETCTIMEAKGAPRTACIAGLCHSVYGTKSFSTGLLSFKQRKRLRDIIGSSAERLVYLYAVLESAFEDEYKSIVSRIDGQLLRLSEREGRALRLIIDANSRAQDEHYGSTCSSSRIPRSEFRP